MEWLEKLRLLLVRWHVAPLFVLVALGYWTHMSMLELASFPEGTGTDRYALYSGIVVALLGFMFKAFQMLLNGVKKEGLKQPLNKD